MSINKLTYLASPYSLYPGGKQEAFELVCKEAARLMLDGCLVFCPIAHSHPIEELGMNGEIKDGEFWLKQDFAILECCDEVWVYMMPGWDKSYGVKREITRADALSIPIKYLPFEGTDD